MSAVLLTGFERFGTHAQNASEAVVRSLGARPGLRTAVLPVSFRRAGTALEALLQAERPRAVLLLGLHDGSEIRLERVARNRDEANAPDEDGEHPPARAIVPGGPAELGSTLPLADFSRTLGEQGLPWVWSDDAGGFLCNHVFYRARRWSEQVDARLPCGFLHLPPLEALPLERQRLAITTCLSLLPDPSRTHPSETDRG